MLMNFSGKAFDILIQAGQSNAEGYGFGDVDSAYQPNERVWYMNSDMTISRATESVVGNDIQSNLSLSFAQRYLDEGLLQEGRELLILRCAVGGTSFSDNRWTLTGDLYLHMLDMIQTALELNPDNCLIALLWHQGETDAINGVSYEVHRSNLSALLNDVTQRYHVPSLPFVTGDFVSDWKSRNQEICAPIIQAIRAVCDAYPASCFVETADLNSNRQELTRPHPLGWGDTDTIHFSRPALYELGNRFFDAFISIREEEE